MICNQLATDFHTMILDRKSWGSQFCRNQLDFNCICACHKASCLISGCVPQRGALFFISWSLPPLLQKNFVQQFPERTPSLLMPLWSQNKIVNSWNSSLALEWCLSAISQRMGFSVVVYTPLMCHF